MCFILPIWFHQDLNYQDPTQKNIAPGFSFLSVPSDLKDNAEVIEFGPTYGVGVDKDGYVYEWGQLTKNLKKIPADMGKVVDIAVGQDHVLAINDKGSLYTWGFNPMGLNVIPPELKGKLRIQSAGGAVYLRPEAQFPSTRLVLQDVENGTIILLDISAVKKKVRRSQCVWCMRTTD